MTRLAYYYNKNEVCVYAYKINNHILYYFIYTILSCFIMNTALFKAILRKYRLTYVLHDLDVYISLTHACTYSKHTCIKLNDIHNYSKSEITEPLAPFVNIDNIYTILQEDTNRVPYLVNDTYKGTFECNGVDIPYVYAYEKIWVSIEALSKMLGILPIDMGKWIYSTTGDIILSYDPIVGIYNSCHSPIDGLIYYMKYHSPTLYAALTVIHANLQGIPTDADESYDVPVVPTIPDASSDASSDAPSDTPSDAPSNECISDTPSNAPSDAPSDTPSDAPSNECISDTPSNAPSDAPSNECISDAPSDTPSDTPSDAPSNECISDAPSDTPSDTPSDAPSNECISDAPSDAPDDEDISGTADTDDLCIIDDIYDIVSLDDSDDHDEKPAVNLYVKEEHISINKSSVDDMNIQSKIYRKLSAL